MTIAHLHSIATASLSDKQHVCTEMRRCGTTDTGKQLAQQYNAMGTPGQDNHRKAADISSRCKARILVLHT